MVSFHSFVQPFSAFLLHRSKQSKIFSGDVDHKKQVYNNNNKLSTRKKQSISWLSDFVKNFLVNNKITRSARIIKTLGTVFERASHNFRVSTPALQYFVKISVDAAW